MQQQVSYVYARMQSRTCSLFHSSSSSPFFHLFLLLFFFPHPLVSLACLLPRTRTHSLTPAFSEARWRQEQVLSLQPRFVPNPKPQKPFLRIVLKKAPLQHGTFFRKSASKNKKRQLELTKPATSTPVWTTLSLLLPSPRLPRLVRC